MRELRELADDLTMPSAVLAGGVLSGHPGRDYHVRRLLDTLDIAPVDEALAHAAGFLRTQTLHPTTDTPPSGVDAIVVAHADTTATHDDVMIVTSDEDDITALAIHTTNTSRLTVRLV